MAEPGLEPLRLDGEPHDPVGETSYRQQIAATPGLSAWVSANAGSGKTHVLANRVIRLLLAGARPSAILCLTYTKAAAAEMSNRVFRILAGWTRMPDSDLAAEIARLEGRPADRGTLERARQLFAMALETPGGLKIQTIHAFCEAVLQRFPLEANIAGRFQVLDDQEALNLLAEARRLLFSAGSIDPESGVPAALDTVLDIGGEAGLDALLSDIYRHRRAISAWFARVDGGGIEPALRAALGIAPDETRDDARERFWPLEALPADLLRTIEAVGGSKAKEFADQLLLAGSTHDLRERSKGVIGQFLTNGGKPRAFGQIASKPVRAAIDDIEARLAAAQGQVLDGLAHLAAFDVLDANLAAASLARHYIADFERLKHRQAFLDFDDLVAATDSLLQRSGAGAWVHYKLDRGIDHILVDEAQDTAPLQWNVIRSLAAEFFAGESARGGTRTLFSVGDEKQSIYSFQGARPESFAEERKSTERKARAAGMHFEPVSLRVSFRSTRDVLKLVDLVYEHPDAQRGMGEERAAIVHESARGKAPGVTELWPMIAAEKTPTSESWTDPFDVVPESAPAARLAARISATIEQMIGRDIIFDARTKEPRTIRAGDILVLVRKRDGFVPTLLRMLKARGDIPVAGADRLNMTDHIAVQDLIALGRHVLLSDDDLSLAALAKSPLVGLSEDDLFRLAGARPEAMSVADHLAQCAEGDSRFAGFHALSQRWRRLADELSVHDFYATILGPDGGRARYLARLGSEVGDVLDEFLGLALDHDEAGIPGLQSFISSLETESPEIKREMEQEGNAVRVMTVHASKGLEAPVVFLVDSGGAAFQHSHMPTLWFVGASGQEIPLWLPNKEMRTIQAAAPAIAAQRQQAEEEYRRLLYVGLTRPADRLIMCGYRGVQVPKEPTWHSMVEAGFDHAVSRPELEVADIDRAAEGETFRIRRMSHRSDEPVPELTAGTPEAARAAAPVFACPQTPLPRPQRMPRPLIPSSAGAALTGDGPEMAKTSPFAERPPRGHAGAERGRAAHRLLQILPGLPDAEREPAARRYVERALASESDEEQAELVSEVLAVLGDDRFAPAFGGEAATEVSVMGTVTVAGQDRVVSGRIDRLAVFEGSVLILDYKTGAMLPGNRHHPSHAAQLAIYRELVAPLYPGRAVRAALLYTALPELIELSETEMAAALEEIARAEASGA